MRLIKSRYDSLEIMSVIISMCVVALCKGVGYLAWKWIRISLESRMVSWYKNEIIRAGVSNRIRQCLNFLVLNVHIPTYLGLRGKPFFLKLQSFFSVSADCRLVRICIYKFVLY